MSAGKRTSRDEKSWGVSLEQRMGAFQAVEEAPAEDVSYRWGRNKREVQEREQSQICGHCEVTRVIQS